MQSNNPVFRRSEEFNRGGGTNAYGNQTYAGNGSAYPGYGDPSTWGTGQPGQPGQPSQYGQPGQPGGYTPTPTPASAGPMTIDSVVQKTAMSLGVVFVAAIATWILTGDVESNGEAGGLFAALAIGSLGAFALSMVNSFKRVISPALVLAFCVFEGVAMGALSKAIDLQFEVQKGDHGIVVGAVLGTFAAFAGTLAVYKFANIKVGQKFRTMVMAAVFGMVGLSVLELVLGLFGAQIGLFGFGGLGLLFSIVGLALGVFMLVLDFDFIEQGIANGLPERESWRAAFALTVSLVWIYTNLLRILAILSDN